MFLLALAIAVAFCVACGVYDVTLTERGLKAGVAVEGNTFLVGTKPTAKALYLRDALITVFTILPALIIDALGNGPAAFGLVVCPVVYGIKHIAGGRAWAKLLKAVK